ncbi:phage tail fiber protein [Pseudodesulfovibrio thermohalotolerans]|uniref:phage tail fiber protein n=1 Tax=Pseudodesulfovibrio thermohalotolerans TaxID=2880651 RepID=UPI002441756D|nr:phage tail fiber protein [Pseudodesulfovibrio thermohalotolerans]WFS62482.1 phage tail fiber protein [Pseudodesulfovibrio thermohalotolerans]
MTVSSTETKILYAGNGSTAAFAIPFMFLRNDDIDVLLVDAHGVEWVMSEGTDYGLTGAGEQAGGVCSVVQPPESGQTLVIRREPDMVQEVDYVENDAFPAATHEAALDKLTMICQALAEKLDRALTFRVSTAVSGVNLPKPDPDRMLGWNSAGSNLVNKDVMTLGAITTPVPISQGGTDADNPTEALFNLGFGAAGLTVAGCEEETEILAAIGAEPVDAEILRSCSPGLLKAVYGDEAQSHEGRSLAGLVVVRNHVTWSLTGASQFSDVVLPYDGTYVFHVYPLGHDLVLAASYKLDGQLPPINPAAGEIRIAVEQFNSRKTIVSLQNMEA